MGKEMSPKKKKELEIRHRRMLTRRFGLIFCGVYLVITLLFISQVINFDVLSLKYLIPIIIVLLLITLGFYRMQMGRKVRKAVRLLGRGLMIFMGVILCMGTFYLSKTSAGLNKIANGKNTTNISVVTMKDSGEEDIMKMTKAKFGRAQSGNQTYIVKALADIEYEIGKEVAPKSYDSLVDLVNDLYSGKLDAVIMNEGMRSLYTDAVPDFEDKTNAIWSKSYEQEVTDTEKAVSVTEESFNVYISGIDTYGTVDTSGHSDVNMIVTVNPKTHQVLMTSIPRDYYIPQACQDGMADKLTHTGIWGVESTVEAVDDYFDVDINYYLKVNFSGVTNILTAIGDIEVDNPYEFTGGEGNYHFEKGNIKLDAPQALSYARERQSFVASDEMRIQNQSRVLEGVIKKVTSPSILSRYAGLIDALSTSFQTNMSRKEMNALVKMQIDDMPSWNISQISVAGQILDDAYSPASGANVSVVLPDDESVDNAVKIIKMAQKGKDIAAAVESFKNNNKVNDEVVDPYFYESRTDLGEMSDVTSEE